MRNATQVIIILLLLSCNATRSYVIKSNIDRFDTSYIKLDFTYKLYVREVLHTEDKSGEYHISQNLINNTPKVIEVEYLLISEVRNNVIYIATRPDKYQNYYSEYLLHPKGYINAYDFFMFHFGKIISDSVFEFKDEQSTVSIQWTTDLQNEALTLKEFSLFDSTQQVGSYIIGDVFNLPVTFQTMDSYQVVLLNWNNAADTLKLVENRLYVAGRQGDYSLFFEFSKMVPRRFLNPGRKKSKTKNTFIKYKNRHIKYNPKLLVDQRGTFK